jgi:hypothetical protein
MQLKGRVCPTKDMLIGTKKRISAISEKMKSAELIELGRLISVLGIWLRPRFTF